MASMQGIIDEGSDHIKDLELKMKTQGRVLKFLHLFIGVTTHHLRSCDEKAYTL